MNEKYQVKQITKNNKGLFAKKIFIRNDQIMECQPIAWATLQSIKSKVCNWCLFPNELVLCSQCKCFYYCSAQCQKNDWKYHKFECKIYKTMCSQKNLSIHKQITTQFVFNTRLFLTLQQNALLSKRFYQMLSLQQIQPLQTLQKFQSLSLIMMQNLNLQKNQTNMRKLMKQFNIVSINAFTIQDLFYTNDGVAVGIYLGPNYINHQCKPNSTQLFDGKNMKIISNTKIGPGEQLTISYTSALQIQKYRNQFLKQHYMFQCFCELCQVQKMVNTQYSYIKCPQCGESKIRKSNLKPIQQKFQTNQPSQQQINEQQQQNVTQVKKQVQYICNGCNKKVEMKYLKQIAQKIQKAPKKIQQMNDYKQQKQQLLSIKKLVDLSHPTFCLILQSVYLKAVSQSFNKQKVQQQKLLSQANILLSQIIKNLPLWYKIEEKDLLNIKFFNKFNQMSKLKYNLGKLTKSMEYLEKALQSIEKINLKHKYIQITQLRMRYDQVKIQLSINKTKTLK